LIEVTISGDKGLLNQVFGLGVAEEHGGDDFPDVLLIGANDGGEGVDVSA